MTGENLPIKVCDTDIDISTQRATVPRQCGLTKHDDIDLRFNVL